jgi:hypothetical protein
LSTVDVLYIFHYKTLGKDIIFIQNVNYKLTLTTENKNPDIQKKSLASVNVSI